MTGSEAQERAQYLVQQLTQEPSVLTEVLDTPATALEPICPEEGVERYLKSKETEVRPQTISEYRRKLSHFIDFCSSREIDNLNNLARRNVDDYLQYRRNSSSAQSEPLSNRTMRDEAYLLQDFLRYLESIDGVPVGLSTGVRVPSQGQDSGVRDIEIPAERVEKILDYLKRYNYASREHVVWTYYSHTGRRPGSLYGLDIGDLYLEDENPHVHIRHCEGETELKNGQKGEAEIYLSESVGRVFQEYLEQNRIDVVTENGREPFLTSKHGRLSKSTMRRYVYRFSRSCVVTGDCPHSRDPEECEAAQSSDAASKCPSSYSPYALRHGYITAKRRDGVPKEIISDRCDVSPKILEKHYDERDETEKRELRQKILEEARQNEVGGGYL